MLKVKNRFFWLSSDYIIGSIRWGETELHTAGVPYSQTISTLWYNSGVLFSNFNSHVRHDCFKRFLQLILFYGKKNKGNLVTPSGLPNKLLRKICFWIFWKTFYSFVHRQVSQKWTYVRACSHYFLNGNSSAFSTLF